MGGFHRNFITEEESRVIAMLAEKMICPECDAPAELNLKASRIIKIQSKVLSKPTTIAEATEPKSISWNCTNSNCDQSK